MTVVGRFPRLEAGWRCWLMIGTGGAALSHGCIRSAAVLTSTGAAARRALT
jgi:hypothetical protein